MKLTILIVLGLAWGAIDFLLFEILPKKVSQTRFLVLLFLAFLVVTFGGMFGIYNLGVFWNMETQAKLVLGVASSIILVLSVATERCFARDEE